MAVYHFLHLFPPLRWLALSLYLRFCLSGSFSFAFSHLSGICTDRILSMGFPFYTQRSKRIHRNATCLLKRHEKRKRRRIKRSMQVCTCSYAVHPFFPKAIVSLLIVCSEFSVITFFLHCSFSRMALKIRNKMSSTEKN